MTKFTFSRISTMVNAPAAINGVITEIETAFDSLLSRDGVAPNQMTANVDMNSKRILNLVDPTTPKEPVTLSYFQASIQSEDAQAAANAAAASAAAALASENAAQTAQGLSEDARNLSQAWAESLTAPGGPGTKSSKTWAGEAEGHATTAGLAQTAAETAQAGAEDARDASLNSKWLFATTAAAIGLGVIGSGPITGGSGGTNGIFALAFTGGTGSGAAGRFLVEGGALVAIYITAPGSYTVAPAFDFSASAGLTGHSATCVLGTNVDVGEYFSTPSGVSGDLYILYRVDAGPVATEVERYPSSALLRETTVGQVPPAASTAWTTNYWAFPDDGVATYDGYLTEVKCYGTNAGELSIGLFNSWNSGGNQYFQLVKVTTVAVAAGVGSAFVDWDVTSGQRVGFKHSGEAHVLNAGGDGLYYTTTTPTTDPAGTIVAAHNAAASFEFQAVFSASVRGTAGAFSRFRSGLGSALDDVSYGRATPASATAWTSTHWVFPEEAVFTIDGFLTDFELYGTSDGVINVGVYESWVDGADTKFRKLYETTASVSAGVGVLEVALPISAGQRIGFKHSGTLHYAAGGTGARYSTTDPTTGAAGTVVNALNPTLALQFKAVVQGSISGGALIGSRVAVAELVGPLSGLEWAALGTSLTFQNVFTSSLAALSGMSLTNHGVSGASLGQASNGHYGSLVIYNAIASISTTAKVVTVECCTNDFAEALVALGVRGDSTTATFYGAVRAAIVAIIAQAPSAKIFFISDHGAGSNFATHSTYATNGSGNKLHEFWDAMEQVCADMGVWFIDAGRKAGIGYSNANSLTADGLHLNTTGGNKFATYIFREMSRAYDSGYFG